MNEKYDWNRPLVPGSIVCSQYSDFDGERRTGIFLIIYDETLDTSLLHNKNCIALKLTTQNTLVNNYVVAINTELNNFLDSDSLVCCSKLHLLNKTKEIYKYLGQLDNYTYKRVVKVYSKFARELERQMLDRV